MKKILLCILCVAFLSAENDLIKNCVVTCERCAIYGSSSNQIDANKKTPEDEERFYDEADHVMHGHYVAREYLEKYKIPTQYLEIDTCPTLTFEGQSIDIVPKNNLVFAFILFEKGKKPHIINDELSPTDEIRAYFGIKDSQTPKADQIPQPQNKEKK